jgi:hypothetical protein
MSSKNIKVLEELQEKVLPIDDAELSDDSEITKPKKEKKPYVLTPARKAQFEKARQIRDENREQRKQDKDADIKIHDDIKNDLIRKKELKAIRKKTREIKSIVAKASEISSEDEIIIKTPKLKTKKPPTYKKKVVYESSSDESSDESSSEEEVIQKKKKHYPPPSTPKSTPKSEPKRVIQYF